MILVLGDALSANGVFAKVAKPNNDAKNRASLTIKLFESRLFMYQKIASTTLSSLNQEDRALLESQIQSATAYNLLKLESINGPMGSVESTNGSTKSNKTFSSGSVSSISTVHNSITSNIMQFFSMQRPGLFVMTDPNQLLQMKLSMLNMIKGTSPAGLLSADTVHKLIVATSTREIQNIQRKVLVERADEIIVASSTNVTNIVNNDLVSTSTESVATTTEEVMPEVITSTTTVATSDTSTTTDDITPLPDSTNI